MCIRSFKPAAWTTLLIACLACLVFAFVEKERDYVAAVGALVSSLAFLFAALAVDC